MAERGKGRREASKWNSGEAESTLLDAAMKPNTNSFEKGKRNGYSVL